MAPLEKDVSKVNEPLKDMTLNNFRDMTVDMSVSKYYINRNILDMSCPMVISLFAS